MNKKLYTPWKLGQSLYDDQFPEQTEIVDEIGIIHAVASDPETAKEIVRRINAHKKLVSVCKQALEVFKNYEMNGHELDYFPKALILTPEQSGLTERIERILAEAEDQP